ncbi:MAG: hypothetical protein FJZ90_20015 [Chloroflexi bacterium]|nr:hypothetical protein [Chloroflexota bacterium]
MRRPRSWGAAACALALLCCLTGCAVGPAAPFVAPSPTPSESPCTPLLEYRQTDPEGRFCRVAVCQDGAVTWEGERCPPHPAAERGLEPDDLVELRGCLEAIRLAELQGEYAPRDGC